MQTLFTKDLSGICYVFATEWASGQQAISLTNDDQDESSPKIKEYGWYNLEISEVHFKMK